MSLVIVSADNVENLCYDLFKEEFGQVFGSTVDKVMAKLTEATNHRGNDFLVDAIVECFPDGLSTYDIADRIAELYSRTVEGYYDKDLYNGSVEYDSNACIFMITWTPKHKPDEDELLRRRYAESKQSWDFFPERARTALERL